MNRIILTIVALAAAGVGGLYGWTRIRSQPPVSRAAPAGVEDDAKHLVTPSMASASRAMLDRPAPDFSTDATDGSTHRLANLLQNGPVLLIFIKDGCPCSEEAQPLFNQLQSAYPKAAIRGVINLSREPAARWAEKFRVAYPLLLDPDGELVRGFGAENSAYVVLIDRQGRIAKHWPGYSAPMLRELGALMAELTESAEVGLDLAGAPSELFSGCPYEL